MVLVHMYSLFNCLNCLVFPNNVKYFQFYKMKEINMNKFGRNFSCFKGVGPN